MIAECVDEVGADLLIIGSHSKRGPLDVGLGRPPRFWDLPAAVILVRPTPPSSGSTS
jgi:hypothetical protein